MIKIAPSILSADFSVLAEELERMEYAGADLFHIDVMDGHFVPNITIGPCVIEAIKRKTRLPLDVHLMIDNPDLYIDDFVKAGADILTVHVEVCPHIHRTIQKIKSHSIKVGVALNPATPLGNIELILGDVDTILLMTVNPGFGGQNYITTMTKKIRSLADMVNQRKLAIDIEVDGGITLDNSSLVVSAGASIVVSGSTIFKSSDVPMTIMKLRRG